MAKDIKKEEHTLLDWFDEITTDLHVWLDELKDRREKNLEEIETKELIELSESIRIPEPHEKKEGVIIDKSSMWQFWIIWAISALIGYFLFQSLDIIYLVATGLIVSMAAENFIHQFQQWLPRGFSMLIVYILLLVFLLSWVLLVIPFLVQQTAELIRMFIDWAVVMQNTIQEVGLYQMIEESSLPRAIKDSLSGFIDTNDLQNSLQASLLNNISNIVSLWSSYVRNAWWIAFNAVFWLFSAIFNVVIVFMVAIFCSFEKEWVIAFLWNLSSEPARMVKTIGRVYHKLWNWLVAQLMLSLIVGLLVGLWLLIMSRFWYALPNASTLAVIAGLTEFIPYMWPIIWGIPGLFVALVTYGWTWFLIAMVMYGVVQRLENNVIVPLVMSKTLWVSPLLIFITMIIAGLLLWILGVVIAVPIAVIVSIMYKEYQKSGPHVEKIR